MQRNLKELLLNGEGNIKKQTLDGKQMGVHLLTADVYVKALR